MVVLMSMVAVTEALVCASAGIEGVTKRAVLRKYTHPFWFSAHWDLGWCGGIEAIADVLLL